MSPPDNPQRIVHFLAREGEASVDELARGLNLTQVTVRHHLRKMIRTGLVAPPEKRRTGGPGRPEQVYALTPSAEPMLPGNYPEMAQAVLAEALARQGPEWLRKALWSAGLRAASNFEVKSAPGSEAFVPEVLAELDRRGYLAAAGTWSGRRCLTFSNCPYLAAARTSPSICAFDQALVEKLFSEPAVLFRRIADHDATCMFLLGAASGSGRR